MRKSDKSKHNITIASIKRSTIKPYDDFKWTKFYESNSDFLYSGLNLNLIENELIICSTIINSDNYSILTTQKLITNQNGIEYSGSLINAKNKGYGNFKGYQDHSLTLGHIELKDGTDLKYFIETGRASMVMINGIGTLISMKRQE
ncbi:hypothetical protein NBT05_17390 [Aquimarina sp. ERC-38]|uniref:hypothetical protein n=1 Tax=Aquimarina sp. ERC-38 TaxID=2949996 RepID=UPI0022476195|nr:hypothetical protein [Aquimarina sp. ERC-38]UZO80703.1 hypothetical protein NBT05_17390 [Aquimarina sp. ERC-38]